MMNRIRRFLGLKAADRTNEFYEFAKNIDSSKNQKIMKKVIRQADEDQRDLVKRYEERFGTTR